MRETGGLELASTITLVLQANRQTKCASHPSIKRMSGNTLKFNNIWLNKKEFHKSKQAVHLSLVTIDQIVASDKFKHSDDGFKYFIDYQKGEIVKPLCIILPQMIGYIKYLENGGKNMSFLIKDDGVREK